MDNILVHLLEGRQDLEFPLRYFHNLFFPKFYFYLFSNIKFVLYYFFSLYSI